MFSSTTAKTVSEAVTWKSLYLVVVEENFILAEPHRKSHKSGRVVSTCSLQNLEVALDDSEAAESTVARRLMMSHQSYTQVNPPPLFIPQGRRNWDVSNKKDEFCHS